MYLNTKRKKMKKKSLLLSMLFGEFILSAAQVGINTTTPNLNSVLDVNSSTKGLLLPRVALTATNNPSPLTAHVAGMEVYNTTANTSSAGNEVYPGEYYNDGTRWYRKISPSETKFITGGTLTDAISATTVDVPAGTTTNTSGVATVLSTISFTLDKPSIVDFIASITMRFSSFGSGAYLQDGSVKLNNIFFQFSTAPAGFLGRSFGADGLAYTNSASTTVVADGIFTANPNASLRLPAGNYVLLLAGNAYSGGAYRVIYGSGNNDMFQIKATPIQ